MCDAMSGAIAWGLIAAVTVVALTALAIGAQAACFLLAAVLVAVAVARWLWRRERPAGLAVRSWPVDVLVSLTLAVLIAALALSPGV